MNFHNQHRPCHAERSEESDSAPLEILRYAQNDRLTDPGRSHSLSAWGLPSTTGTRPIMNVNDQDRPLRRRRFIVCTADLSACGARRRTFLPINRLLQTPLPILIVKTSSSAVGAINRPLQRFKILVILSPFGIWRFSTVCTTCPGSIAWDFQGYIDEPVATWLRCEEL